MLSITSPSPQIPVLSPLALIHYASQSVQFSPDPIPPKPTRKTNTYVRRRRWKTKQKAFQQVAALPDALLITAQPYWDTSVSGLSLVDSATAQRFQRFATKLRRAGADFALRVCTRDGEGNWFVHLHGVVVGLTQAQLERFSRRCGLALTYCWLVENPKKTAGYITGKKQSRPHDRVQGRVYLLHASALGAA